MWGNRLGWAISAAIVFATVVSLRALSAAVAPTPPSALSKDTQKFEVLELPIAPSSVLGMPVRACDAAAGYARALALYEARSTAYDDLAATSSPDLEKLDEWTAIAALLEEIPCGGMTLFSASPESLVNYDPQMRKLGALRSLGLGALRLSAALSKANRLEDAGRYAQAAFALGSHLWGERLTYTELNIGQELMGAANRAMIEFATRMADAERAEKLQAFERGRVQYMTERVFPIARALQSADPGIIAQHAGDVAVFARSSKERLWRVEAVLNLGRTRFNAPRKGDELAARRRLAEFTNDPDPAVRAAAKAGLELTVEQFRVLR